MGDIQRNIKWLALLPFILLVFLITFIIGISAYRNEGLHRSTDLVLGNKGKVSPNRLDIESTITSIDPVKGTMMVRMEVIPMGDLGDEEEDIVIAADDIKLYTSSPSLPEISFKRGRPVTALDIDFNLYGGQYEDYPLDRHNCDIQIWASASEEEQGVPIVFALSGAVHGFDINVAPSPENARDYVDIEILVSRSDSTKVWAIFIMAMLWLMTLSVVGVTYSIVLHGRKLEIGSFGWIGALLFAFVAFRNAAPGVPPIGSMIDFISFFWCEVIAAICMVTMVATYLKRPPPPPPPPT